MSNITQEDFENFNLEEIDDYNFLEPELQDDSYDDILVSSDCNNYNFEYNVVLRNDENELNNNCEFYGPSSVGLYATSNVDFFSSDPTSTAILPSSSVSPAVSSPVRQLLQVRIKEKMRAEGRQETSLVVLPQDPSVNQLTPEEEMRKNEKQQRNKEAARRSRQKKKEEEDQLLKDNKDLTTRNEELKLEVALFKNINEKCEQFFSYHQCAISSQQDNGDKMCVETGRSKVWDDNDLVSYLDEMNIYGGKTPLPFSQGSKSQRVSAIVSHLQGDLPSEVVPSGTVYNDKIFVSASAGYSIGIQENVLPDSMQIVANNDELQTHTEACGGTFLTGTGQAQEVGSETEMDTENIATNQFMPQGMSHVTGMITRTNSSSVRCMKKSALKLSAWSTGEDNQSESDEDLNFVRGIHPPPVKKIRLE